MLFLVVNNIFFGDAKINNHSLNFFLKAAATIDVPTKVADQYSHRLPTTPTVRRGPTNVPVSLRP